MSAGLLTMAWGGRTYVDAAELLLDGRESVLDALLGGDVTAETHGLDLAGCGLTVLDYERQSLSHA